MSLGDAFLTGIISGVSAGAFSKVGSTWFSKLAGGFDAGLYAAKIAVHGAIGGIASVLQGGKFGHGFASAGFTAAASGFNNSRHFGPEGFSWKRVAVGAAIGGSASKLSGGKFANGAITGAFSQALNNETSEERTQRVAEAASFLDNVREFYGDLIRNAGELFDPVLFPAIDASFDAGEYTAQYWANQAAETGNPIYDVAGGLSVLWTCDTASSTALTLSTGGTGNIARAGVARFFGPFSQWIRFGSSWSISGGYAVRWSLRWGASPGRGGKWIRQIPSPILQRFNQYLRSLKLPGNGW